MHAAQMPADSHWAQGSKIYEELHLDKSIYSFDSKCCLPHPVWPTVRDEWHVHLKYLMGTKLGKLDQAHYIVYLTWQQTSTILKQGVFHHSYLIYFNWR